MGEAKDRAKEMKTKALLATVPGAKANLKKKTALSAAATKKAKKLADIAHKIAADPKNLKKMGKISAASAKAASAHSKMFVAEIEVSKAKAHMKNALKIAGKGKRSRRRWPLTRRWWRRSPRLQTSRRRVPRSWSR